MILCRDGLDWSYNTGDVRGRPAYCPFDRSASRPRVRGRARRPAQLNLPLAKIARLEGDRASRHLARQNKSGLAPTVNSVIRGLGEFIGALLGSYLRSDRSRGRISY